MLAKKESEVIVKSGKEYYELVMGNYTFQAKSFISYRKHYKWQILMTGKMKSRKLVSKIKRRTLVF